MAEKNDDYSKKLLYNRAVLYDFIWIKILPITFWRMLCLFAS